MAYPFRQVYLKFIAALVSAGFVAQAAFAEDGIELQFHSGDMSLMARALDRAALSFLGETGAPSGGASGNALSDPDVAVSVLSHGVTVARDWRPARHVALRFGLEYTHARAYFPDGASTAQGVILPEPITARFDRVSAALQGGYAMGWHPFRSRCALSAEIGGGGVAARVRVRVTSNILDIEEVLRQNDVFAYGLGSFGLGPDCRKRLFAEARAYRTGARNIALGYGAKF